MSATAATIAVSGERPYDVVVGTSVLDAVPRMLGSAVRRVALVHQDGLSAAAALVHDLLAESGVEVYTMVIPDGEAAKTAEVAAQCWANLGRIGFTRSDAIVSLGGGAATDLAGFVAATFLRGLRLVHVPTTLLAMVDAAVGGKTGINTAHGKNLVGVFHEPAGVVCELAWLETLPPPELVAGLAEVVKCGFIADPAILELVTGQPAAAVSATSDVLRELVERSIRVKARVVATDLREATSAGDAVGREALNYGHTLGHAVERREGYRRRHGEAVAIGMVYAAELAERAGVLAATEVARHREVLGAVGLPASYPAGHWPELRDAMRVDKKSRGDRLRFVILAEVGRPVILEDPEEDLLEAAYEAISTPDGVGG